MVDKKCTKCGEVKPVECFTKRNASKDGHASWCKSCTSVDGKNRYIKNRVAINRRGKEFRDANKEVQKKRHIRYREELEPSYVALVLRVKVEDLTPEILKLKREQIELKRLSRQIKTLLKEKNEAI